MERESGITGLVVDCTGYPDVADFITVRVRALNGFIVGEDSLGIRLSQPAGARHFGEATPATDVGDDSQDWAVFNGDCETAEGSGRVVGG
ncbi:unnamed protein product [Effrenium voratum]|uniref:Uncharacterized protein n=1 Tax=Effrenium voratum TaxID=2562239 RepID=A0AA36I0Z3_9DINO|nr:unnamed protein product [Effrenium voratum]